MFLQTDIFINSLLLLIKLKMFAFYSRLLDKYPIVTKAITSGTLFSLGDVVSQKGKYTL